MTSAFIPHDVFLKLSNSSNFSTELDTNECTTMMFFSMDNREKANILVQILKLKYIGTGVPFVEFVLK